MQQFYKRNPCWSVISIKLLCTYGGRFYKNLSRLYSEELILPHNLDSKYSLNVLLEKFYSRNSVSIWTSVPQISISWQQSFLWKSNKPVSIVIEVSALDKLQARCRLGALTRAKSLRRSQYFVLVHFALWKIKKAFDLQIFSRLGKILLKAIVNTSVLVIFW